MASKRLLAIVTALMLAASGQMSFAGFTLSQLRQIEQLILDGQWTLLKAFLDEHPEMLEGNSSLAVELRIFVTAVNTAATPGAAIASISLADIPDIGEVVASIDSY